jgi:ubiquitin carboxyl-terminal hydrolase 34
LLTQSNGKLPLQVQLYRDTDRNTSTCLKDVPDNLIFHLKRFDFDLVDMRRAKINDHFAFPDIIDVSLYNIDYLSDTSKPREEDIFELVGVLVHQGTSENGHYYSYIRERPSSSGSGVNWVEFNDRDVDNFDHQSIPHQAFGGFYDDQFQRQPKQFSAYMLFYQRRTAIEKDHHEYIVSPHCGSPKVPIPPELEASINADNELFVREHNLLDPNHSKFIRQILATLRTVNDGVCSEDHQQEAEALRAVLSHLCQVIIRQRNLDYFDETIAQLRRTALSCPVCCQFVLKWLGTHDSALLSLLLQCPNKKVRSQMRNFLIESLVFIREKDSALYYGGDSVDSDMENGTIGSIDGVLLDIVHRLSLLAEDTYSSIRGWDDYYLTLICVCEIGYIETAMILNTGMLEFCLKIFCMHASSQFRLEDVDLWRIMEKKKPVFNRMIEFVYHLLARMDIQLPICNCYAKDMDRLTVYDRATGKFPLGQIEVRLLRFWDDDNKAYAVLDRMTEIFDCTKTEAFYPGDIFKWLLETPDQSVQERLMWTLVDGITSIEPPFQDNYIRAAVSYCEACPRWPLISKVLEAVVTSTTKLRDSGGEVALRFFAVLPNLDNEHVLDEQHVDRFYLYALEASPTYAVPLLIYDDPDVRKGTASHLDDLFRKIRPDEFASNEALRKKYRIARTWAPYLIRRIVHEHQNGSPRVYMTPLIQTCGMIVSLLLYLANAEEPALVALQHPDDMNIVQQYHQDIENRVRIWAYDEGTPISTGG